MYIESSPLDHPYSVEPEMIIIFLLQVSLLIKWFLHHYPYLLEPSIIKYLENIEEFQPQIIELLVSCIMIK